MIACLLVGAKLLSKPMLEYYWLDPSKQTSVKFLLKLNTNISVEVNMLKKVVCEMLLMT